VLSEQDQAWFYKRNLGKRFAASHETANKNH
jgi:hypothetical protein